MRQRLAFSEAQGAGGVQQERQQEQERQEEQERMGSTPAKKGRKPERWGRLGSQGKRACTASIQEQLEQLAEERGTEAATITANILHR